MHLITFFISIFAAHSIKTDCKTFENFVQSSLNHHLGTTTSKAIILLRVAHLVQAFTYRIVACGEPRLRMTKVCAFLLYLYYYKNTTTFNIYKTIIMKKYTSLFLCIWLLNISFMSAQHTNITVGKSPNNIEIVQVDFQESSTLLYMKYISGEGTEWLTINEKAFIRPLETDEKYPLINSFNLPLSMEAVERFMVFDEVGQEHHFVLEFERLPETTKFDLIEMEDSTTSLNFYDIEVDTTKITEHTNVATFIANYPVKEQGRHMKDGKIINWIRANNIILNVHVKPIKQYGKYYQVDMNLQNRCGKPILFDMDKISAKGYISKKGKLNQVFPLEVLSYQEYDKKVANKQAWNNFFVALGEGAAASNAGYSRTTTISSTSTYGYVGNSSIYTTSHGLSTTYSYNGAAAYAAQQNAAANYRNYANSQDEIRQQLNDGYTKNHTLYHGTDYSGFFNIKYKKVDSFTIEFVIDGISYSFTF